MVVVDDQSVMSKELGKVNSQVLRDSSLDKSLVMFLVILGLRSVDQTLVIKVRMVGYVVTDS